ncbi:flagellar biosynthesis protein [Clostridium botulinum]|uniref:TIGR02530 family flagellar biosynthesis protein n=1 Tax=Clostridium TaxID=1485 RepID=UPI000CF5E3FA|nr:MULTISPECIES: TIGR02530 family flagellar biosynthesis protein [Clostridium]MBN1067072.1 flagellar biosynthesis protein [Clostridium botulinum]NFG39938.1 flagellar biosynthesis protein [Clostridium botulinum]NFI93901.1 flagellar biosynthesis protein [Clostridium botulinum]NFN92777.1 flagellar biosynthesis protein [Clostridium botulinum]NFO90397.1 flagellar biosynthesis protein [Clostridium botulinum]
MSYRIINGQVYPIGNFEPIKNTNPQSTIKTEEKNSFKDVLNNVINKNQGFIVSKHAAERLNEINFTDKDMQEIEKGFQIAKDKNSKNSVILYKDTALIASIENRTLITAVEKERAKDNIFTNIDSVVIL